MGAQVQQADEYSPLKAIDQDPDAQHVIGKAAAIHEAPMTGESAGVLHGHYVGRGVDVVRSFFFASAPAEPAFEGHAPYKYADELLGLLGTEQEPGPIPGAEAEISKLNVQATVSAGSKEPKIRASDPPSAGQTQANLASSPGDLLPSSESAMLGLIFGY